MEILKPQEDETTQNWKHEQVERPVFNVKFEITALVDRLTLRLPLQK